MRTNLRAFGLLLGIVLLSGCGEDETNPLSAKEEQLIGSWRLDVPAVDDEDFEFTYAFGRDGSVTNRIGGAFLKRLQEVEGIDIEDLKGVDGGVVNLRGQWTLTGDTLDVVFETLDIALFGSVLGVRLSVPVHQVELDESEEYSLSFVCSIAGDELTLKGKALTLGVPLGEAVEAEIPADDVGTIGRRAIELARDFLLEKIREDNLDEAVFVRVK